MQIQLTLFKTTTYYGIRVSLADLLIPFICGIFIYLLYQKRTNFPTFHIKNALTYLFILGVLIFASFIHGYLRFHELNYWAIINKSFGWFVLMAYFVIGGWLVNNVTKEQFKYFLKLVVYFFIIIATLQFIRNITFYLNFNILNMYPNFPASAYMANKNTFIFLFLFLLAVTTLFYKNYFRKYVIYYFYFLIPFSFTLTMARAGFLVFPILLIALYFLTPKLKRKDWLKLALSFLLGALTIAGILLLIPKPISFEKKQHYAFITQISKISETNSLEQAALNINYKSDSFRLKVLDTTLNIIKESPVLGHGLGSIKKEQIEQWGEFLVIMDSTPLWLWAETGLIGLLAFLAFYVLCLKTLYQNGFNKDNCEIAQNLNKAVFILLIIFAGLCLFHEILYTRFMWLFMGMALAYPLQDRIKNTV